MKGCKNYMHEKNINMLKKENYIKTLKPNKNLHFLEAKKRHLL